MRRRSESSDQLEGEVDPGAEEAEAEAAVVAVAEAVVAYLLVVDLVSVVWKIAAWVVLLLREEEEG